MITQFFTRYTSHQYEGWLVLWSEVKTKKPEVPDSNPGSKFFVMNNSLTHYKKLEELDGRAVSALGVRSRKLSTGFNGQS
jgi:hypothetical protein